MNKVKIDIDILLPEIPSAEDECIDRLINSLNTKQGISEVHLTGENDHQLCIHYNSDKISGQKIRSMAQAYGAQITDRYRHLILEVSGIRHSRHARIVGKFMLSKNGILEASASTSGSIRIEYDSKATDVDEIQNHLRSQNLTIQNKYSNQILESEVNDKSLSNAEDPSVEDEDDHHHGGIFGENTELFFSIISGVFWLSGLLTSWFLSAPDWVYISLFSISVGFGGFYILKEALESTKILNFDIDFLMLVAAAGAIILGRFQEAALLLFLFSLGHALEHFAMNKARKSISALSDLAPPTALLRKGDEIVEVAIEELEIGDIITIRPNSKIAADGAIISGETSIDQSSITGESIPVDKQALSKFSAQLDLDKVSAEHRAFSGTINGSGNIDIIVLKKAKDSTLSRLVSLVKDAEAQKSPTQRFTDKFEKYFVPIVIGFVSLLLFAFLVIDETFSDSFYRSMTVLVAASPCALAISTPSAVLAAVARAAKKGVLVKGGGPLENLGSLEAIAFDKTGTLTEGKPKLSYYESYDNYDTETFLKLVIATEELSDHPLAAAIVEDGMKKLSSDDIPTAHNLQSLTARGVVAEIDGKKIHIGNRRLMNEISSQPIPESLDTKMAELEETGNTAMIAHYGDDFIGIIAVMDIARKEAKATLDQLKKIGMKEMVMLTGDNQKVAESVAESIGITNPLGNLLPEDKVASIQKLKEKYGKVAMVGDGVNDAPAMAQSTVGISMGAAGSDVALETADIALMSDRLDMLPFAIGLSRKTNRIIKQNLWISLGMVAILVPLTLFGIAEIGPAVIAHEGSTLLVVANAMRLLRYEDEN